MGDASDNLESPMFGQQNVFPDTTASTFPEAAIFEISASIEAPRPFHSTPDFLLPQASGVYGRNLEYSCFREGTGSGVWEYIFGHNFSSAVYYGFTIHFCVIAAFLRCFVSAWECLIIVGIRSSVPYSTQISFN